MMWVSEYFLTAWPAGNEGWTLLWVGHDPSHTLSLTWGCLSLTHSHSSGGCLSHSRWGLFLSLTQSLKWGLFLSHTHGYSRGGGCLPLSTVTQVGVVFLSQTHSLFHTHTHSRTLRVSFLFFSLSHAIRTHLHTHISAHSLIHSLDLSHTYTLIHTHSPFSLSHTPSSLCHLLYSSFLGPENFDCLMLYFDLIEDFFPERN